MRAAPRPPPRGRHWPSPPACEAASLGPHRTGLGTSLGWTRRQGYACAVPWPGTGTRGPLETQPAVMSCCGLLGHAERPVFPSPTDTSGLCWGQRAARRASWCASSTCVSQRLAFPWPGPHQEVTARLFGCGTRKPLHLWTSDCLSWVWVAGPGASQRSPGSRGPSRERCGLELRPETPKVRSFPFLLWLADGVSRAARG